MSMGLEEALAVNYLGQLQETTNYVWAWIAFLTAAAISFWKIKLSSVVVHSSFLNHPCLPPSHQPETINQQEEHEEELPTASLTSNSNSNSNSNSIITSSSSSRYTAFCSMENRRSGKFTTYYYDDNTTTQSNFAGRRLMIGCSIIPPREEKKQELLSINYFEKPQQQQGGWEWEPLLLKMKTTEMVWYRYQDLTVLDGNVVRLWN